MKNYILPVVVIIILGFGIYYLANRSSNGDYGSFPTPSSVTDGDIKDRVSTSTDSTKEVPEGEIVVIGKSVEERDIKAYNFGGGEKRILFIGGIHGGYSWNTTLVANELIAYLKSSPNVIPKNVKVTVVPILNPDGLSKVVSNVDSFKASDVNLSQKIQTEGRYNKNKVDLSRNFDCDWQKTAKWRTTPVSGGSEVFSEPEAQAIKNYIETHDVGAVVVWYSSAGGVYASNCGGEILPATLSLTSIYSTASGYPGHESFDFYETSGDLPNWLSKMNVPAISVLLTDHKNTEWDKNKKGVDALLQYFAK